MPNESEADAFMHHAKKRTKKSLFCWNPNYEDAAYDYCKAAKIYAGLRCVTKAMNAWQEAAQAYKHAQNLSSAAGCLESLGAFLVQNADEGTKLNEFYSKGKTCYEDAAKLYEACGEYQKQADALLKEAYTIKKCMEVNTKCRENDNDAFPPTTSSQPRTDEYKRIVQNAIKAFELSWKHQDTVPYKLFDLYQDFILQAIRQGDILTAVETQKRMLGFLPTSLSDGAYDESKSVIHRMKYQNRVAKIGLEIVVLCLSCNGDDVWARQEFNCLGTLSGFRGSQEQKAAAALLAAYEERDPDQLTEAIKSYAVFNFILADISRMVRKLRIGGGFAKTLEGKNIKKEDAAARSVDNEEEEIDFDDLR